MRIRGFPFSADVQKFIEEHERVFVVEQNRDAQLKSLLTTELNVAKRKLLSILHYDGLPLSADRVIHGMNGAAEGEAAA
ncbi:MAG: 2-oxoacid:acceptor oxidoreductase subunit alpha, partial [Gammaproteobacteria bacterium]|nr:2-oxoacid:acceptor oxidoreductase subunit alpha [Gammaproteobacteria bacterium]